MSGKVLKEWAGADEGGEVTASMLLRRQTATVTYSPGPQNVVIEIGISLLSCTAFVGWLSLHLLDVICHLIVTSVQWQCLFSG